MSAETDKTLCEPASHSPVFLRQKHKVRCDVKSPTPPLSEFEQSSVCVWTFDKWIRNRYSLIKWVHLRGVPSKSALSEKLCVQWNRIWSRKLAESFLNDRLIILFANLKWIILTPCVGFVWFMADECDIYYTRGLFDLFFHVDSKLTKSDQVGTSPQYWISEIIFRRNRSTPIKDTSHRIDTQLLIIPCSTQSDPQSNDISHCC